MFVVLESIIEPENMLEWVGLEYGTENKHQIIQYQPHFVFTCVNNDESCWMYTNGKWKQLNTKCQMEEKNQLPNLNLEVTLHFNHL